MSFTDRFTRFEFFFQQLSNYLFTVRRFCWSAMNGAGRDVPVSVCQYVISFGKFALLL